jgi:CRISPR-associated protein Cas5t
MDVVGLYVSVPVAAFRVPQAREYLETLPCPPPSTVYGMLLAVVGELDRLHHVGAEIALARLSRPASSVVLRTLWRVKKTKVGPGIGENKRPDFQELLTGVRLAVWLRQGSAENATPALAERVQETLASPTGTKRFGGLSLGESTHLVDEVRMLREGDPASGELLIRDREGGLALPIWPDHVGSAGTRWEQYRLVNYALGSALPDESWTAILQPETVA